MRDETEDQAEGPTAGVPALIAAAGDAAVRAYRGFVEDAGLSVNTRRVYRGHVRRFCRWAEARGLTLTMIDASHDAAFTAPLSASAANEVRSALRALFGRLVAADVLTANPFPPRRRGPAGGRDPRALAPVIPLAELKQAAHELDPTWEEDSEFFRAGLVALAPAAGGTLDPAAIAAYTGVPEPEVRAYAGRLLANRMWRPDGTVNIDPDDPDGWGTTLIVHVLIALGHVACQPPEAVEEAGPIPADDGRTGMRESTDAP